MEQCPLRQSLRNHGLPGILSGKIHWNRSVQFIYSLSMDAFLYNIRVKFCIDLQYRTVPQILKYLLSALAQKMFINLSLGGLYSSLSIRKDQNEMHAREKERKKFVREKRNKRCKANGKEKNERELWSAY